MMANEPYQRISQDNGVFDGTLVGMAVGAGGASAGIFGSRMSYNGIEKQTNADINRYNDQKTRLTNRADKYSDRLSEIERKADTGQELSRRDTSRGERAYKKHSGVMDKLNATNDSLEELTHQDYLKNKQSKHAYSNMRGGWRKAGIIGASSVIAGGIGMGVDSVSN